MSTMRHWIGTSLLAIGLAAGCAGQDRDREGVREAERAASPADTTRNVSVVRNPDTAWTAGVTVQAGNAVATLLEVRTALHDGYERMVFEFDTARPGYHIEYVDRPVRQCGSGDVVELPGDAWLSTSGSSRPTRTRRKAGRPCPTGTVR
jgi:hypothetical protein